ncbi:MAG: hypothetical protein EOS10_35975 [Mesorhizobium sp.]|uniref:DUF7146 domain-containing protein n=1 Tax=unclassified Mesorhizobium TaxID=325217 RepID=UPI000FCCC20C|nr:MULTISPECIES: hypothetical protein [unclassified Mesorhizobium]RWO21507.1 MAG: hypothetical protein EOS10_35975 [Mesorhizobium sp.]TIM82996.1 MAG: hypothetical protein E5Y50_27155 [Mesorhizobium sp.]TIR32375.1 MAG: hypothetical protein E5X35_14585 [Mesorhizobium sp.]TIX85299.1 MAG: hypothetical protein E5V27_03070 [Mesorhizobium sp.]TIX94645.1 MAG: hypothetical protein E5V24_08575 [Mesorhizobium sp.]
MKARLGPSDDRPIAASEEPTVDGSGLVDEQRRIDIAATIWAETVPLLGTLGERYLASRGLAYYGEEIRYHAGLRMMVAMMTDAITGEPCGVHRTLCARCACGPARGKKLS